MYTLPIRLEITDYSSAQGRTHTVYQVLDNEGASVVHISNPGPRADDIVEFLEGTVALLNNPKSFGTVVESSLGPAEPPGESPSNLLLSSAENPTETSPTECDTPSPSSPPTGGGLSSALERARERSRSYLDRVVRPRPPEPPQ